MKTQSFPPEDCEEYKNTWLKNAHIVSVASNEDIKGKGWCRQNCQRWQWKMNAFSTDTGHDFLFEFKENADEFKNFMHV